MVLRSSDKPPLARSPIQLRSRRKTLEPIGVNQSLPGTATKSQLPSCSGGVQRSEVRPEYQTMSWELTALAKKVHEELGAENARTCENDVSDAPRSLVLFERGKFYDEYSARRNERLKRKKSETMEEYEEVPGCDDGARVEMTTKKREGMRRRAALAPTWVVENREVEMSRYSLRSGAGKKPPVTVSRDAERSKVGVIRTRKAV